MIAEMEEKEIDVQTGMICVEVTQEDIDHGFKSSNSHCPIGLALQRMGYKHVSVGKRIWWAADSPDFVSSTPAPPEACKFIEDFDSGKKVKPFTFWVSTKSVKVWMHE